MLFIKSQLVTMSQKQITSQQNGRKSCCKTLKSLRVQDHYQGSQTECTEVEQRNSTQLQVLVRKMRLLSLKVKRVLQKYQNEVKQSKLEVQIQEKEYLLLLNQISSKQFQYKKSNTKQHKLNTIEKLKHQYLHQWQKRIQVAQSISLKAIVESSELDQELKQNRGFVVHQLWKWVMVCCYGQSAKRYLWERFREDVLKQRGNDLIQRLGRSNASKATVDQVLCSIKFLQNSTFMRHIPCVKQCYKQLHKIIKCAELYLEGYRISQQVRQLESQVTQHIGERQQKLAELEQMRKVVGLMDWRIRQRKEYNRALSKVVRQLEIKGQVYDQVIEEAKEQVGRIKKGQSWDEETETQLLSQCPNVTSLDRLVIQDQEYPVTKHTLKTRRTYHRTRNTKFDMASRSSTRSIIKNESSEQSCCSIAKQ